MWHERHDSWPERDQMSREPGGSQRMKIGDVTGDVDRSDLAVTVIFPTEVPLQQQTAARRSIRLAENLMVRRKMRDRRGHPGQKFEIVFGQFGNAGQAIRQFG